MSPSVSVPESGAVKPLVLVYLFALGCGGSQDVVAKHRAAAEPQLTHIAAIAKAVAAAPPTTVDRLEVPAGVVLDLKVVDIGAKFEPGTGAPPNAKYNTAIVNEALLTRGCQPAPDGEWFRINSDAADEWLKGSACALAGKDAGDPATVDGYLHRLERTRYLLVLRTKVLDRPKLAGGKTFTRGHVVGDALLFEIASEKALGGFGFEFQSADAVDVSKLYDEHDELTTKFLEDADQGIRAKLAPR